MTPEIEKCLEIGASMCLETNTYNGKAPGDRATIFLGRMTSKMDRDSEIGVIVCMKTYA